MGVEGKRLAKAESQEERPRFQPGHWRFDEFPYKSLEDPALAKALDEIQKNTDDFIARFELVFQGKITPELIKGYLEERGSVIDQNDLPTSYLTLNALLNTDLEPKNLSAQEIFSAAWVKISNQLYKLLQSISDKEFSILLSSPEIEDFKPYLIKSHEKAKFYKPENDYKREILSKEEDGLESRYSQLRNSIQILSPNSQPIGITDTYLLLPQLQDRSDKKLLWERLIQKYSQNSTRLVDLLQELTKIRIKQSSLMESDPLSEKLNGEFFDSNSIEALSMAARSAIPVMNSVRQRLAQYNGLEKLEPWDFFPESALIKEVKYSDAIKAISLAWSKINPQLGEHVSIMDRNGWIDVSRGLKVSGRQANFLSPIHTFPKVRYDNSFRAFRSLAHELGHAIYSHMSRNKEMFAGRTPHYHLNEMIALFSEKIAVKELVKLFDLPDDPNPKSFFGDKYNIIHHNLQLHHFERQIFKKVSDGDVLSSTDLNDAYNSIRGDWGHNTSPESSNMWLSAPHFFTSPNYFWMYAVGEALAGTLEQLYVEDGDGGSKASFGLKLVDMLKEGSSRTSRELFKDYFSLDINSPAFWAKTFVPLQSKLEDFDRR